MHTEVHVHGNVLVLEGASQQELEQALTPWLSYVDIESLSDAKSAQQDEPGIVFDRRRRMLEICWTGWVGRNFQKALETAFEALCPYTEEACGIEVTYYHDDGRDEHGMVFVGPSLEAVQDMQRNFMVEDVSALLSRHFNDAEIGEVVGLVNQLFDRRIAAGPGGTDPQGEEADGLRSASSRAHRANIKKHLH